MSTSFSCSEVAALRPSSMLHPSREVFSAARAPLRRRLEMMIPTQSESECKMAAQCE